VYETFEKMQEEHDSDIPQQTRLLQLQWHWQHAIANPSYSHPHQLTFYIHSCHPRNPSPDGSAILIPGFLASGHGESLRSN
jgi:hypothetical protein